MRMPLLALLLLAACAGTPTDKTARKPDFPAPGRGEAGVSADCAAWASAIVGPYKYENNVWGIDKARTFTPEQCLLRRTKDGQTEIGWGGSRNRSDYRQQGTVASIGDCSCANNQKLYGGAEIKTTKQAEKRYSGLSFNLVRKSCSMDVTSASCSELRR